MSGTALILAAAESFADQVQRETQKPRFNTRDVLLAIGASLAVGMLLFIWAYFKFRKKPGIEFGPGQSEHPIPARPDPESSQRRRRRKRQRRRDHRPRNPTLNETGGLPPPRPEGELPKY